MPELYIGTPFDFRICGDQNEVVNFKESGWKGLFYYFCPNTLMDTHRWLSYSENAVKIELQEWRVVD